MSSYFAQQAQKILRQADIEINGSRPHDIQVHNEKLYAQILRYGSIGLGEAYMEGWWDAKNLDVFFVKLLAAKLHRKVHGPANMMAILKDRFLNDQNKKRSKRVAEQHYDYSNDFYEKVLDKRMLYTCGYWKHAKNLDEAQDHKLELVCQKVSLKKGEKVLDLGCGWGSFSKYAAEKYGCEMTAVNISTEQVRYVRESCKGFPVEVIHADYREALGPMMEGKFDKIVSIGMMEHVGFKNYRKLMELVHACLKDGGLFLLHTIGSNLSNALMDPWLDKYIFPGALLPSIKSIAASFEGLLVMEDWHNFGPDYDKTLLAWFHNLDKNWPELKKQYDEKTYRMWKYYLLACAASFRVRENQLWQVVLSKGGVPGGYQSIR